MERHEGGAFLIADETCIADVHPGWFDPKALTLEGALSGAARGRGSAWFVRAGGEPCVLRHYFRGGLAGKLTQDLFVWNGLARTRAWREWHLLALLQEMRLPAPKPMAAAVWRRGCVYRCDIITYQIPDTRTLADELLEAPLEADVWARVGTTISRFHQQGIWHADLNARNILLNRDREVFLIDFDKARMRSVSSGWQAANLDRLLRSLRKFGAAKPRFPFHEPEWSTLLQGYQG